MTRQSARAVVILLALPVYLAYGQSIGRIDCLELADANGKAVGWILGASHTSVKHRTGRSSAAFPSVTVAFEVNGFPVLLQATRGRLRGFLGDGFLFESTDCSGTAFRTVANGFVLDAADLWPLADATIMPPGNTLYLADPNAAPQIHNFSSELRPPGPFGNGGCNVFDPPLQIESVPAVPLIDLNTVFTAPFKARKCIGTGNGNGNGNGNGKGKK